ncbi:hypothetical protein BKP37_17000 [Anaerobacillus alkalilacustris]|uniref:IDEAL domain-containing protein n=1 Tax=Anaerobacillus alkalilacustris TaxID=393763 RepID=A0A1S2LHB1_9BACI|nr:YpiB family protein [Anaerobacillus alkalilacustris]OIJ11107.1 hypothetical protein BKP37_17000 [Anaerobacillus alkalilacustris]
MGNWVSAAEKSSFLKWFLEHYQLKQREARMFLEYLLKKHHILQNLSFTDKIKYNEKTVVISSIQADEPGFVYYSTRGKSENVSAALNDLMSNPTGKLNIILHFQGKQLNYRYLKLLESKSDSLKTYRQFEQYSKDADALINKVLLEQEIKFIKLLIDEALDNRDEKEFKRLIFKLQDLENELASKKKP